MLPSATEREEGSALAWHPGDEYTSQVLFDIIGSRSAVSGLGNDGRRFEHLQFAIHTNIGRKEVGKGMTAFWWRVVDNPNAFPL